MSPVMVNPSRFGAPPIGSWVDEITADNPILWWRLGETSGTTAADNSGHSNTGTYINSPTLGTTGLITGDTDKAVTLNGTNQRVQGPSTVTGYPSAAMTVEIVIKPASVTTQQVLISKADVDAPFGSSWGFYLFQTSGGGLQGAIFEGSNAHTITSAGGLLTAGGKYLCAVRIDASSIDIVLNGTQVATGTSGLTTINAATNAPVMVGDWYQTGADHGYYSGVADEALIFPTKLSNTRLAAHTAAAA